MEQQAQFKPWLDRPHPVGAGTQQVYRFDNGYGASVVRTPYSYGGSDGLYELGVVKFTGDRYSLNYDTPITDDVLGYLTEQQMTDTLAQIAALPASS